MIKRDLFQGCKDGFIDSANQPMWDIHKMKDKNHMIISRAIRIAANGIILFFLWLSNIPFIYNIPLHIYNIPLYIQGLPWWLSGKESTCQCRRHGFDPWVGKIPQRRKWQPTPVFLPGESHGWKSQVGYSPRGRKESDMTEQLHWHWLFMGFSRQEYWSGLLFPSPVDHFLSDLSTMTSQSWVAP